MIMCDKGHIIRKHKLTYHSLCCTSQRLKLTDAVKVCSRSGLNPCFFLRVSEGMSRTTERYIENNVGASTQPCLTLFSTLNDSAILIPQCRGEIKWVKYAGQPNFLRIVHKASVHSVKKPWWNKKAPCKRHQLLYTIFLNLFEGENHVYRASTH